MLAIRKYLFLISILYLNPCSIESSLYEYLEGQLRDKWTFNLTIFAKELRGIIFYTIDSRNNQFGITVFKEINDKFVLFNYNKISRKLKLKSLCGCNECVKTLLNFSVKSQNKVIEISCNARPFQSMSIEEVNSEYKEEENIELYPTPLQIISEDNSLYVNLGDIGPYLGEKNITIHKSKDPMVGCLYKLFYNGKEITMRVRGMLYCYKECKSNVCNGGICQEQYTERSHCTCSNVPFNGKYCNESLKMYQKEENNTYTKEKEMNNFKFKMTWKPLKYKNYCLLNIVGGSGKVTLWIKGDNLMVDSSIIKSIKNNEINFVTITYENNYLVVNVKNLKIKIDISHNKSLRINVGFTETEESCKTFEGVYDLNFNTSEFSKAFYIRSSSTTVKLKAFKILVDKRIYIRPTFLPIRSLKVKVEAKLPVLYIGLSILFIIIVLCMAIFIIFLRNKKSEMLKNSNPTRYVPVIGSIHSNDEETEYSKIEYNLIQHDADDEGYAIPIQNVPNASSPPLPPRNLEHD